MSIIGAIGFSLYLATSIYYAREAWSRRQYGWVGVFTLLTAANAAIAAHFISEILTK